MGLYYVLHIAKQRNKNALQRLLPSLGKPVAGARPLYLLKYCNSERDGMFSSWSLLQ